MHCRKPHHSLVLLVPAEQWGYNCRSRDTEIVPSLEQTTNYSIAYGEPSESQSEISAICGRTKR